MPYEIVSCSLDEFKNVFVDPFDIGSNRLDLYQKHLKYTEDLTPLINGNFRQWIDGSFASTKLNPNDLDMVTIIPHEDYERNRSVIDEQFIGSGARKFYGLDAYIVEEFPSNHSKGSFTEADLLYWMNLFGKTRINRSKKRHAKGFIQLNF